MGTPESRLNEIRAMSRLAWRPPTSEIAERLDEIVRANRVGHARRIGGTLVCRWLLESHGLRVSRDAVIRYMRVRDQELPT